MDCANQLCLIALSLVDKHFRDINLGLVLHNNLHLLGGPGAVAITGGAPEGGESWGLSDCQV